MLFLATKLHGAYLIELEKLVDERGFFARSWCQHEFAAHGLDTQLVQCNLSFTHQGGTLRGLHYQLPPWCETKLVRCLRGAIYDVILDLRPDSATFLQWTGVELTADNRSMVYVPKGFAHGFITLTDDTELFYQMSTVYAPSHARGVRWNDPLFAINWPLPVTHISRKDQEAADATPGMFQALAGVL